LCRDILYEVGAGIHIMMDDRTNKERMDKLGYLYDDRHEALEAAMSDVLGDGLSLSGFIMQDAHSARGALSTAFVRQLECDIVAMGTLRASFDMVYRIRTLVNIMSDLLFVVDVRTREGEQEYWEGLGF
jgi:cob(I)alamin adenosyltransferase